MFDSLLDGGRAVLPFAGAVIAVALVVIVVRRIVAKSSAPSVTVGWRPFVVALTVAAVFIVLLFTLPMSSETRGQLVGLLGVAFTAIIALSSTTFVTNAMAGLMLRLLHKYRPGDWIQVADHFGRVTELGVLHTEIQTEDRDLTTIPNLFMVTQPVKVVRASGTIVSAGVSLGYDAPRVTVNEVLMNAATRTDLSDPFVQITELGDFSVGYRVGGFLSDVTGLVGTRSRLRANMMDALHGAGVEIVSPAFMNQRQTPDPIIPIRDGRVSAAPHEAPEDVVFDKATRASDLVQLEEMREERHHALQNLKEQGDSAKHEVEVERLEAEIAALDGIIEDKSQAEAPD